MHGAPHVFALSSHDLNGPLCEEEPSPLLELPEVSPLDEDFELCPLEGSGSSIEPLPAFFGSSYSTGFRRGPQATMATEPATTIILSDKNDRVTGGLLGGHGGALATPAIAPLVPRAEARLQELCDRAEGYRRNFPSCASIRAANGSVPAGNSCATADLATRILPAGGPRATSNL